MMWYRKFVRHCIGFFAIGIMGFVIIIVTIDPLNIIGFPVIVGYNHYKAKEGNYLDLVKSYQVANYSPKVIFIGSSRVYVGWCSTLQGYRDDEVYNLGGSSLSLPDIENYLDYVYLVSKPEIIFLGLDFFQFGVDNINEKRTGFSRELLQILGEQCWVGRKWMAWCKSYEVRNTLKDIVKDSFQHRTDKPTFIRGWDVKRGSAKRNSKAYEYTLESYKKTYSRFSFDSKSMDYIKRIVQKAKENKVKLYLFFNPMSKDLYELLCSYGHEKQLNNIKTQVREMVGIVYELKNIDRYNSREDLYYDASHYNYRLGEILKEQILNRDN